MTITCLTLLLIIVNACHCQWISMVNVSIYIARGYYTRNPVLHQAETEVGKNARERQRLGCVLCFQKRVKAKTKSLYGAKSDFVNMMLCKQERWCVCVQCRLLENKGVTSPYSRRSARGRGTSPCRAIGWAVPDRPGPWTLRARAASC